MDAIKVSRGNKVLNVLYPSPYPWLVHAYFFFKVLKNYWNNTGDNGEILLR